MKTPKSLIIIIFIFSFLSTSVSSKFISFCLKNHNSEKLIPKNFSLDYSCHSSDKKKKEKQLCTECDCFSNSTLINTSLSVIENNFFNSDIFKFNISQYSFTNSLIDPPPRKFS